MQRKKFNEIAVIAVIICVTASAFALEKAVFRGRVFDVDMKPVKGAEIFVYTTPNTRRPADFISARTDIEGRFSMTLPVGKYWVVARLRKGEKYGPLMIGDKHSGDPVEIELEPDEEFEQDFIVIDIREAARLMKKTREDYFKLKGRIIDHKGKPVKNVYAIADKDQEIQEIPDYISAWTDDEGHYTLYLPAGRYYVGYATEFPPEKTYRLFMELDIKTDKEGFDIVVNPSKEKTSTEKTR
jgi:hypothetical protein